MNNYDFCKFKIPENGGRVLWEITNECNYACTYCIFSSTGKKPLNELSTEKIISTIHELKKTNFNSIKLTGGEPFLHPDILLILQTISNLQMHCDISTNASLITEQISQTLSSFNISYIHVSLDGHDSLTHNFVRGKTFDKTINGIKLLLKYNSNIRIGCVIHEKNEFELEKIIQLCQSMNLTQIAFSLMEPVGRLKDKTTGLSKRSKKDLISEISLLIKKYPLIKITHNIETEESKIKILNQHDLKQFTTKCPAGEKFLFINSLGIVQPCSWTEQHIQNIKFTESLQNFSLHEILQNSKFSQFQNITQYYSQYSIAQCPATTNQLFNNIFTGIKDSSQPLLNKFNSHSQLYSFTTENLFYFNDIDFKNKSVLCIGSSYDYAILAYMLGAKSVHNIDLNNNAKYWAELKHFGILNLSFNEFISFFMRGNRSLDYEYFEVIEHQLSYSCRAFWRNEFKKHHFNGSTLRESSLFNNSYDNQDLKIKNSIYLLDEKLYKQSQNSLYDKNISWQSINIMQHDEIKNSYDIILLSNISDYSHKMFNAEHIQKFKNNIVIPYLNKLNDNGTLMFSYIYDYENKLKSNERNEINNKQIRQLTYGTFVDATYSEIIIPSAISTTPYDCACILKKG